MRGQCQVCGCTQFDPCMVQLPDRVTACSWADAEARDLCSSPDCMEAAGLCSVCTIPGQLHTPLMVAGCAMRSWAA